MPFASCSGQTTNDWSTLFSVNLEGKLLNFHCALKNLEAALGPAMQMRIVGESPFGEESSPKIFTIAGGIIQSFDTQDRALTGTPPPYTYLSVQVKSLLPNVPADFVFRAVYTES